MLHRLHRLTASLLLPLFMLEATGCTHVVKKPVAEVTPVAKDEIVGITTLAGVEIKFDATGVVRDDTVRATAHGAWVIVPVDSVQRWWLRRSNPVATVGLVAGVTLLAIGIISVVTYDTPPPQPVDPGTASCPFVYSWNGTEYVFEAEPFGGAITHGLERDDYSVLPSLAADGGRYRLLMINEMAETQMANLAELWAIDHAPGVQVLPDEWGALHTIAAAIPPAIARTQSGTDLTKWLSADDALIWEPAPVADSTGGLQDEVVLTFPRPANVTQAKLVTRVGTSLWGAHVLRSVLELRGRQVQDWYNLIDSSSAAVDSVHSWALQEALYGLEVDVESPGGWEASGVMGGSGPYMAQTRVVMLELPSATDDSLRIRVRATRGFWAFNYLAVDYSADQPVEVDTLRLSRGVASNSSDLVSLLSSTDSLYYVMPTTGDRAELEFPNVPLRPGMERTVLLHTRGFYQLHLQSTTEADTALLRRIENVPGATAQYSAMLYQQRPVAARPAN